MRFFQNRKQKRKYKEHKAAIKSLQLKIKDIRPIMSFVLSQLPDDCLCNLHYQKQPEKCKKLKAKDALSQLSLTEKMRRIHCIQLDYNYDGSDNPAPVCIIEIPYQWS